MPVEIIAEIGVNHNNDLDIAKHLIRSAKNVGADMVKFQASTVAEEISERHAPTHYAEIKKLVPTFDFLKACAEECQKRGIEFLCTPAGEESLNWVLSLGVRRIKVASDNLTNVPFLRAAAGTGLPLILSTGMASPVSIGFAASVINRLQRWRDGLRDVFLHCGSAYPLPVDQANLLAIKTMTDRGLAVGWSDHTTSETLAAVAVSMGAVMIEKHLTYSRLANGPDHEASLDVGGFGRMVAHVREVERALGSGIKEPVPAERENMRLYGKSLVASRPIARGDRFTRDNVAVKRPGGGESPVSWDSIMGAAATRDYEADELL